MSLTLLLDGCGNPTWSQVGANWARHIIYGQLAPLGVLWLLRHNPFQWPYPAVIGLLGQFPPHQPPRPSSLILGLGGPFVFQGPPGSLAITIGSWPTPFISLVLA
ncbi:hypothetical protein O181_081613 [Austropuccinia psidii MF-1]|uniref:Uncharacterized protein n=1 Tax=Austropuccinia psidii MF-1 TaxID=1389203 RepID=A0A9Q3IHN5_9BASI|nr:hypothetical protein [Austropuccinia psidii MF-1]